MSIACTLFGPRDLRLTDHEVPAPGEREVRVRLGAGGICGSDLHYYEHGRAGIFAIRAPFVPGHEASGVVESIGVGVTQVKVGDKVAVNPSHPCSAAIFPHLPGLFREHFIVGERQLTPISEAEISLGEIAWSVLGKTVLITGGGTIGCMTAIAARIAGAARIIVSDLISAAELAASADVCIEAAGHPSAVVTCLTAAKRGGRIIQVGTLPSEMTFPANQIMSRELEYVGAFRALAAFDWAVEAIRTRRADVRPIISAQLPLAQSQAAFDLALDRQRSTKVQITFD
eukprot:gene15511-15657_t